MSGFLALVKSIGWLIFLTGVGMLQLITIFVYKEFSNELLDINDFIYNGFFLFLCISTLAGICYEFYVENDIVITRYVKFAIGSLTCIVIITSMLIYSIIYFKNLESLQAGKNNVITNNIGSSYVKVHIGIIITTALISLFLKTLIYYNQNTIDSNGR